jgi:Flp pilus assembly pilin Flp
MNLVKNFLTDESGAELAEYAVACAIMVAVAIIVLNILGQAIVDRMNDVASDIDAPPAGGGAGSGAGG